MSQNENDGFAQFTATGGELNVPFDFKIADRAEIKIIRKRSGVETTLVLNTDYTIADNQLNQDLGGVAVLIGSATPALASDIYTALLNTPYSRGVLDGSSDFNQSGDFFAATLNKQFDFVIRMINRLARDTGKSLKFSETLNQPTAIITQAIAAGKALIAGSTPGTFVEGPDASQIASAQGYASASATSASNAATSETNAQSWATAAQSAATGINWTKARAASTANVNIASPGAAIDGVTLVSGDRVLLKNQSTASQNGIYVWNGAAVAMTRATDMDTWAEVVSKVVQIEEGTVNADLPYMATVNTGGTLGSTSITFTLFQAPLQDGAVSTALKIVDGIITYAKMLASEFATTAEIIAGAASKFVNAANLAPLFYGCSLYQTTGTTLTQSTWVTVLFDTEEYDDGNWHSTSSNTSRITVDYTGRVFLEAKVLFGMTANAVYGLRFKKNGTVIDYDEDVRPAGGLTAATKRATGTFTCAANDYFEIEVYQNGAVNPVTNTGQANTIFKARRVK